MNQFELFTLIFLYLDFQWKQTQDETLRLFLSDMNPFLFADIGSAVTCVYHDFCNIIQEPITIENSLQLAKKYIASLNDEVIFNAFSTIDPEEWFFNVEEYLATDHKGKLK